MTLDSSALVAILFAEPAIAIWSIGFSKRTASASAHRP